LGSGCGEKGALIHCCWESKLVQPLWKQYGKVLKKLKIDLSYNSAIILLGIYLKEGDSGYYKAPAHPSLLHHCSQ
jgi:hypothetical protein